MVKRPGYIMIAKSKGIWGMPPEKILKPTCSKKSIKSDFKPKNSVNVYS